jgi:hypothetical protein
VPLHLHKNHCAIKAIETPSFSSEEEDQPLNRKLVSQQNNILLNVRTIMFGLSIKHFDATKPTIIEFSPRHGKPKSRLYQ